MQSCSDSTRVFQNRLSWIKTLLWNRALSRIEHSLLSIHKFRDHLNAAANSQPVVKQMKELAIANTMKKTVWGILLQLLSNIISTFSFHG